MENRIVIILAILLAIFFFSTLSSCNNARRQRFAYEKERATRIQLEEREGNFSQERSASEEKAKALREQLTVELEKTKKVLTQEQLVNQSLKEELQKVTQLKAASGDSKISTGK